MKIAFSGHRSQLWRNSGKEEILFVTKLRAYLSTIEKPYIFIVGGCTGVDFWAARFALSNDILFELHVPFPITIHSAQQRKAGASNEDSLFLLEQHQKCIKKITIAYEYREDAYALRDRSMVDSCDLLLAYYFRESSGTGKCVRYAKEVGKPIVNLRTWKG